MSSRWPPASTSRTVVPVGYDHVIDLAWPRATSAVPVDATTRPSGTITLSAGPFQRNAGPAPRPSSKQVTDAEGDAPTESRRPASTNVMAPSDGGAPRPWHVEWSATPAPAGNVAAPEVVLVWPPPPPVTVPSSSLSLQPVATRAATTSVAPRSRNLRIAFLLKVELLGYS
jgi:hypothetical protein